MIDGGVLFRYLARHYALWFCAFLAGLSGIVYLFEVAELLRRSALVAEVTFGLALRMGIYKLPETVEKILPFVVLFAGMFTFWKLTRTQELIVARASGVSVWQFLGPPLAVTFLFGALNVALLNPIGAAMIARYGELEARHFRRGLSLDLTGAGLWLRQDEGDRSYLLHADKVSSDPVTLRPLIAFVYDKNGAYLGRIDAPKAVLDETAWIISNAWFNAQGHAPAYEPVFRLNTNLTFARIQDSMAPPETVSFWKLPAFADMMESVGLPTVRHDLRFHALLAQPFLLCAMVLFAAAFSLRLSRRGGILPALSFGVLAGAFVFGLNSVVAALGAAQTLPVFLAAWAIPLLSVAGGQAALLYLEDG